jgi:hypothetical protein
MKFRALWLNFLLVTPIIIVTWSDSIAAPAGDWTLRGRGVVTSDTSTLDRLTGGTANTGIRDGSVTLVWPDAQLQAAGRTSVRVRLEITVAAGPTMPLGGHTPYPGLITKVHDARGTVINLTSGRTARLRLMEQGSWLAKFIHSDSAGHDHLALDLPFSLHDFASGARIGESRLMVGFGLSDRTAPTVNSAVMTPLPYEDLRLSTADVGAALETRLQAGNAVKPASPENLAAVVSTAVFRGVEGRDPLSDLSAETAQALYGCDTGEVMEMELLSDGFAASDKTISPPFMLRLSFLPALYDVEARTTYLDQLSGSLAFHVDGRYRSLEIGPGNHGRIVSKARLDRTLLAFELGVALRTGTGSAAIARLDIECSRTQSRCTQIRLSTAQDQHGEVVSPVPLSLQFRAAGALTSSSAASSLGGTQPCPGLCPTCKTDGCNSQGVNICGIAGAPIGCTAGCPHTSGANQCCHSDMARCAACRDAVFQITKNAREMPG